MNVNFIIAILFIAIAVFTYFVNWIKGREENSVSNTLITTGCLLIASGVPSLADIIFNGIFQMLSIQLPANEGGFLFRALIGLVLIVLGIVLKCNLKKRVYVLNMYGIATQKDIDEPKAIKDLRLVDYKINEQIIDVVQLFNSGKAIDQKTNQVICKQIENITKKFSAKAADQKNTYFTGMAPIPYTVYAGTFLESAKISRYFEYDAHNGGHYYSLKKASYKKIKKGWDELNLNFPKNIDHNAKEVVLAISITHKVTDADLSQFSTDIIHLALNAPKDNTIKYLEQLYEYKKKIDDVIQIELTDKYPKLEIVHIAASIPSCVSIEIGKIIGLRTNRMVNIVVHHYNESNTPRYVFGLYINGPKKGELWKSSGD